MWRMIMIKHKKNGSWIIVNFYINDLQVTNRCNNM